MDPDAPTPGNAGTDGAPPAEAGPPDLMLRPDRHRRRSAWALLLLSAAAVMAWHGVHGIRVTDQLTRGWWHDAAAEAEDRFDCLAARLATIVPPDSRVLVTADPSLDHEEWRQRVLELVDERAVVVDRPADAQVTLLVALDDDTAPDDTALDAAPGCTGVTVDVTDAASNARGGA